METILFALGTRPEAIKLAPVFRSLEGRDIRTFVVHTGQHHADDSTSLFKELQLADPDVQLGIASAPPGQHLANMLAGLEPVLSRVRPALVVVHGDTTSTLAGALAANRRQIPIAHIEAGLRSYDRRMPEEHNRTLVDHISDLLFAPTDIQADILRREGRPQAGIVVVGNTVADALRSRLSTHGQDPRATLEKYGVTRGAYCVLTLHRQENVDHPEVLRGILEGVGRAARAHRLAILFPIHARTAQRIQAGGLQLPDEFRTLPTIGYLDCLQLQAEAAVVLTDSGGLQEEAAILGVRCVTLRTSTERPETIDIGANRLGGISPESIARTVDIALADSRPWVHPYGDGHSADRILRAIEAFLRQSEARESWAPEPLVGPALPSDGDHTGRTLGAEETEMVSRTLRRGTLSSTRGTAVKRFEAAAAERLGVAHAIACSSGTAAIHTAVASLRPRAGDEIITTPITDMGAITPILYEGAIPVFADVDPDTLNVTAATIGAQITGRTAGIIATHLFGLPCDMQPILELASEHGLPVFEDAAQALLARDRAGPVGTLGRMACYSLQQGKHMTTGEGGLVVTDDDHLARNATLFVNKAWGYGDPQPDHYFPALNYRMTELQGAVALAQLQKLEWVVERRRAVAAALSQQLTGLAGVLLPGAPDGVAHSWWKYPLMVDPVLIEGGAVELGGRLQRRGISCAPRYIHKPAFECALFLDWQASPVTALPLSCNPDRDSRQPFHRRDYPGAVRGLERVIVLPINELYSERDIRFVADAIREEAEGLSSHGR